MSLVEGTSALKQTVEVAETLKVVSETTQQTAEIYSISQYLTETQENQPQAALAAWKYIDSLQAYVPQVVTGLTATAGGAYAAVTGGVAYVLSVPAAFCAIAAALGIGVGVGMYQLNPEFWDTVSAALVDAGCMVGGGVLSILKDGKNYIPESTINVVKQILLDLGAYGTGGTEVDEPEIINNVDLTNYFDLPINVKTQWAYTDGNLQVTMEIMQSGAFHIICDNDGYGTAHRYWVLTCADTSNILYHKTEYNTVTGQTSESTYTGMPLPYSFTYDGKTVYYGPSNIDVRQEPLIIPKQKFPPNDNAIKALAWNAVYNGVPSGEGVEGLTPESGATYPDETKTIPEEYPSWANDGMAFLRPKTREIGENPTLDPDDVEEFRALPVEIPDTVGNPMEVGYTEPQVTTQDGTVPDPSSDPDPDPDAEPVPSWKRVIKGINNITDPEPDPDPEPYPSPVPTPEPMPEPATPDGPVDPPTDDTGTTPAIIPPTDGLGTGLNNIYNPTKAELREFNAFLWSNDFVDTIKKILNDPMQAVIALQMIYCTPSTQSGGTIVVGSIDTEVSSDIVTSQYTSIDCGSVTIPEYFQDYTDYSPYTEVIAYLPFIGFVNLETDDIIGSTVNIKYTVDVFTGCCICEITVTKNNMSAVLYTFNGNCAVQLPLTSATHANIFGVLSGASTALMGIATGNPLMLIGGVASAGMSAGKTSIGRSGSLGSNAGAMGIKAPYILVRRPVAYNASHYNEYIGIPANETVILSSMHGFTRMIHTHVENIESATDREKDMIEDLLRKGVIIL